MNVLIVGAGAQAKYIAEIAHVRGDCPVIGILDVQDNPDIIGQDLGGAKVVGGLEALDAYSPSSDLGVIVASGEPRRKEDLVRLLSARGFSFVTVLHPTASVASSARIGEGVIVNACAVIQPFARIGNHVMIHAGCIVEHNCVVEDFANLAPRATLAGWVRVGRCATLFTGCSVIPGKSIGEDAVVGAGAVVLNDVPNGKTVVGNPARLLRESK